MVSITLKKEIFNDKYYPYLRDYKHRVEIYYGGAASGKSHFIATKILYKAINHKRKVLIIRKVQASQRDSCWALIKDVLSSWKILDDCIIRQSVGEIELPNGSILLFKGLDDPEKIKSIAGITDIWCEECTELDMEDFDQLSLRLRTKRKYLQMFVSFNPVSKASWVYKRWFDKNVVVPSNTLIIHSTYRDNKYLPQEYVDSLQELQTRNLAYYKIYVLGEFASLDKLVYTNWKVEDFDYKQLKGVHCIGLDFGFTNDPTALISFIVDKSGRKIYIFDEYYETGKTNDQIAAIIKMKGYAKSEIIADAAEPKSIEEIKKHGIPRIRSSVKGADSINHGIQYISNYDIIVLPKCENTITELENYSYKKDKHTNEYTNIPIDSFNHLLDALRYGIQIVNNNKDMKVGSKARLGL